MMHIERIHHSGFSRAALGEQGTSILELAIILPVFLVITLASVEISRAFQHVQLAVSASRQVASRAYRKCAVDPRAEVDYPSTDDWNIIEACLENESQYVLDEFADKLYKGSELRAVLFRLKSTKDQYNQFPKSIDSGKYATSFSQASKTIKGKSERVVQVTRRSQTISINSRDYIIIGEAYVSFKPLLEGVLGRFHFAPKGFYDSTIL